MPGVRPRQGQQVTYQNLVNQEVILFGTREITGQAVIQMPTLATKDFFAIHAAETLGALQLVHGTVAGNIVQIDAANVQIGQPAYSERDGNVMLTLPLRFTATSAGDDDIKITVK